MRTCEFRRVSNEAMHILGAIVKSLKCLWKCKGPKVHKLENTRGRNKVFLRELSGTVVAPALHPGVNYPQGEASFSLTGGGGGQATWQTGSEIPNSSSAAILTTKVNSERALMREAVPICRKQVEAPSHN